MRSQTVSRYRWFCILAGVWLFLVISLSATKAIPTIAQGGCTPIADGSGINETISPVGDEDCFTFQGTVGAFVSAFGDNLTTGGSRQLEITLLDSSNNVLASSSSPLGGWDVEINDFHLPATDSYTIMMDGIGDATGPYTFGFTYLHYSTSCTTITDGHGTEGVIDIVGDEDCFTFQGVAGAFVSAFGDNQTSGGSRQLNITLLSPDNEVLATSSSPLGGWDVEINDHELPNTGTYTVVMDGSGDATGPYAFGFSHLPYDTSCNPIEDGNSVEAPIDPVGDEDCFTFQGVAGNFVSAFGDNLTSGGSRQLNITLLDFNNEVLATSGSPLGGWDVEINDFQLPNNGRYTIVMDGSGDTFGPYALGFSCTLCPPLIPLPIITEVLPNIGRSDIPNDINIYGANFQNGAAVTLGTTPLATTYLNATHLRAVVPIGLAPGTYAVTVENPDGGQDSLANAYTVYDPTVGIDDLFGFNYELFTDPAPPRAGETVDLFMAVHREGGQSVLSNVTVRFYQGDPHAGGTVIGDGTILFLSPRSTGTTTAVPWTPTTIGDYTLFAVIDPDDNVAESFEDNNVVSRVVGVLPSNPDQVAPHVDSFAINDDAPVTTIQDVTLDTAVSDPPPSSGIESVFYLEFEYSQAANVWVPSQWSGWLDYEISRINYPWELLPSAGVKYMQAWAADGAGNISLFPYSDFIAYHPPSDSISLGQSRVYRYTVTAGQTLTARIDPISGDPDLYVWAPDHQTRPPWVSSSSNGADEVSFVVPVSGEFQLEVYGYTSAAYQISVEITANQTNTRQQTGASQVEGEKPIPENPVIPLTSTPGTLLALPTPPVGTSSSTIYLPVILRN